MALPNISQAYGGDLNVGTGDLAYNERGQPLYTTGIDTLAQALYRRFVCPPGRLLLHPGYGGGFASFIGMPLTPSLINQIKAAAKAQALLDARVVSVPSVTVTPYAPSSPAGGFTLALQVVTTASPTVVSLAIPIKAAT